MSSRWRRAGVATVGLAVLALAIFVVLRDDEHPAPDTVVSMLVDCSRFRDQARDFVPEMVALATAVGQTRQMLEYSCVDGSPLTTTDLQTEHFESPFTSGDDSGVPPDVDLRRILRRNRQWALDLRDDFEQMIDTGRKRRWSGLLEALQIAARQPRVRTIWFWTDGEVRDPVTGFSLPDASPQRTREEIDAWVPRLQGLRDKTVVMIGGGLQVDPSTAPKLEPFFRTLVENERIEGHLVWILSLDEIEPSELLS